MKREDIIPSDHEEADSRMFVHFEYIANQLSDINNSSKRITIFPPTQMWQFYVGIALANCPFKRFGSTQDWKKQKVHSRAQGC